MFKKTIHTFLIVLLSFSLASNGLASGDGSHSSQQALTNLSTESFVADLTTDLTKSVEPKTSEVPNFISKFETEIEHEGRKHHVSLTQGILREAELGKFIKILKTMEPELRRLGPSARIQFLHLTSNTDSKTTLYAAEALEFLRNINSNTVSETVKIDVGVADRLHRIFYSMFDKSSISDVYWGLARLGGGGSAATLSLYFADYPLPVSLVLGYGVLGLGSGGVGLFIEKFTGWLDNNVIDPIRKTRSRIGSIETYLFLSPMLVGLSSPNLNSIEFASLLGGTAAASVVIQNIYYQIKKRSANAAMWYKWYATEALFVSAVPFILNLSGYASESNWRVAVFSIAMSALLTTASQGVWDILITKIRKPFLEAGILKDLAELSERINGRSVLSLSSKELSQVSSMEELIRITKGFDVLNASSNEYKKVAHKVELEVRERFKRHFYFVSVWSVASAIAMTTGAHVQNATMTLTGSLGLISLGVAGFATWIYVKIKKGKGGDQKPVLTAKMPNLCKSIFQ